MFSQDLLLIQSPMKQIPIGPPRGHRMILSQEGREPLPPYTFDKGFIPTLYKELKKPNKTQKQNRREGVKETNDLINK